MSNFLWTSGHLGWGVFALIVFTGLWWLSADLYWRLRRTGSGRLLGMLGAGWLIGASLIVLGFFLSRQ